MEVSRAHLLILPAVICAHHTHGGIPCYRPIAVQGLVLLIHAQLPFLLPFPTRAGPVRKTPSLRKEPAIPAPARRARPFSSRRVPPAPRRQRQIRGNDDVIARLVLVGVGSVPDASPVGRRSDSNDVPLVREEYVIEGPYEGLVVLHLGVIGKVGLPVVRLGVRAPHPPYVAPPLHPPLLLGVAGIVPPKLPSRDQLVVRRIRHEIEIPGEYVRVRPR
mmetsp:Transcript_26871/g.54996  ORF Transcript_26871/g.54996 Transcript_26871/m.54996 type:complete len:218 (-) Transcript_26871:258-911(-)